jgi:hypothetical protein
MGVWWVVVVDAQVRRLRTGQLGPCVGSPGFETNVVFCAAVSASFA